MELDKAKRKTWTTTARLSQIRGIAQQSRMNLWFDLRAQWHSNL